MEKQEILYVHDEAVHNTRAPEAFVQYLYNIIKPKSVLDIGCGTGTWLSVLSKHGAIKAIGIDGDYVDKKKLHIPIENFIAHDLKKEIDLKEKFDLVICLEVAEHLPINCADAIVKTLTNHSEIILFSAALPEQGGQNHLNEQSFSYWVDKFNKLNYMFIDAFRSDVWLNEDIDVWYRQNTFLIVKNNHKIINLYNKLEILDYYHPIIYLEMVKERDSWQAEGEYWKNQFESLSKGKKGVKISFRLFIKSILNYFSSLV